MSLDSSKITAAAKAALIAHGMQPDKVIFKVEGFPETGKSALELIIDEIAKAVVSEFVNNAVVKTTLNSSLNTIFAAGIPAPPDGGTALQTAWIAATLLGVKDGATGIGASAGIT